MEWEYKIVYDNSDGTKRYRIIEEEINLLAQNGWEPISISNSGPHGKVGETICLMRRKK